MNINRFSGFFIKIIEIIVVFIVVISLIFITKWKIDNISLSALNNKEVNLNFRESVKKTKTDILVATGRQKAENIPYVSEDKPLDPNKVQLSVPEGSSVDDIGEILKKNLLITDMDAYKKLVKDMGLEHKFQYGNYEIKKNQKAKEVLAELAGLKIETHKLTIAEGANVNDVANLLKKLGLIVDVDSFVKKANDMGLSDKFLPGNYELESPISVEKMIEVLTGN